MNEYMAAAEYAKDSSSGPGSPMIVLVIASWVTCWWLALSEKSPIHGKLGFWAQAALLLLAPGAVALVAAKLFF